MDNLGAVAQGFGNSVQRVCRKHKQNVRNIEGNIQIMIAEGNVLFRVEHFQKRARRIALITRTHFIHFVDNEHGRLCFNDFQTLNDFSGHGSDIRAPVPFYFGFVAHTADRKAEKRLVHRARNGTADAGFSDTGRAYQKQDGALAVVF